MNNDIIFTIFSYLSTKDNYRLSCVDKQSYNEFLLFKKKLFITKSNIFFKKKIFQVWKYLILKNKRVIINSWIPRFKPEERAILLF